MAQNYLSGYGAYVNYGYAASYGATGVTGSRVFGHGTKITITRRNNMERIYGLGSRNATATIAKKFEGTASVEFVMSNPSFFRAVLGDVTDDGSGPSSYTHTYSEANDMATNNATFSILTGSELGTNDEVTELIGCKVGSMTLTATQGELVKVRLECPYKTESLATSGIGSQVSETMTPMTFAQGSLQFPSGSTIAAVQSIELTINNSLEGIWGLGNRTKTAEVEKIREYNVRMTVAFSDVTTLLTKFFGQSSGPLTTSTPAATATLVLTFNSGSGTGLGSTVITLANIYLDEETLPKDVNEIIKEDVGGWALSGTSIVTTNSVLTDDGTP